MKTKQKPVVKYRQSTGTLAGEKYKHRYKLTLLATIRGPEADAVYQCQEKHEGFYMEYEDKKHTVKIYEEKFLMD